MTREEALFIYQAGAETVVKTLLEMGTTIDAFQKQVEELRKKVAKLSKNSSNSSKPPSSDDITKPTQKKKGKGKRKIGAQTGHPKHERLPFDKEEIDTFHEYKLDHCPKCGSADVHPVDWEPRIIQQAELKEVVVTKEEHCSYAVWCDKCQCIHYAPLPPEVVKAGLFKELLNRLPFEQRIHVDETGHKENGKKFWTWVFKADLYVLFRIDKSRGSKVLIDVLGNEFDGVLGCDYFSAYRKYMKDFNIAVQFCIAHLIRDIKFLTSLLDPQTKAYGHKLLSAVKDMFKVIHQRETMTETDFQNALEKARQRILRIGTQQAPSRLDRNGKEQHTEAQNMADRFLKHGEAYFQFITTPGIEPTNNAAERAIRFIVIGRVVTQGTRSIKGRTAGERLWTIIATCKLQGQSAFDFILQAVHASFYDLPPPSLLPPLVPDTS